MQNDRHVTLALVEAGNITATLTLPVNPEQLQVELPLRQTLSQTFEGAWLDVFGPGIGRIVIRGTTGYRVSPLTGIDGHYAYKALEELIQARFARAVREAADPRQVYLVFINEVDQAIYKVWPMGEPRLIRSKQRPLLYEYDIQLVILEDMLAGRPPRPASEALARSLNDEAYREHLVRLAARELREEAARTAEALAADEALAASHPFLSKLARIVVNGAKALEEP